MHSFPVHNIEEDDPDERDECEEREEELLLPFTHRLHGEVGIVSHVNP